MLKKIVKKILGLQAPKPDLTYLQYIENKGSYLKDGFSLRVDVPVANKKYVTLGKDSMLAASIIFESEEGHVSIGNESSISVGTMIICRESVVIEDHVFISWGCTICDHDSHSLNYMDRREDYKVIFDNYKNHRNANINKNWNTVDVSPVRICSDAWIGMNCTIIKGVTIGKGAIIGANSVVTKDIPDFAIAAGNPAKIIRTLN